MSFLAKLTIEDHEINILSCNFNINQNSDYTGRPAERPRGGKIELLIESSNDTNFLDWMIASESTKNGKIVFYKRDNMSSSKNIEFSEAYCLEYAENFDAVNSQPLTANLQLSAKEITIKGVNYNNNWPSVQ